MCGQEDVVEDRKRLTVIVERFCSVEAARELGHLVDEFLFSLDLGAEQALRAGMLRKRLMLGVGSCARVLLESVAELPSVGQLEALVLRVDGRLKHPTLSRGLERTRALDAVE